LHEGTNMRLLNRDDVTVKITPFMFNTWTLEKNTYPVDLGQTIIELFIPQLQENGNMFSS